MLIDLHVHGPQTRGCTLQPAQALAAAKALGLDGVLFADLHSMEGLEAYRAAGREAGLLALVGLEVAADHGHYLCIFPVPAQVPAPAQLFGSATPWKAQEVVSRVLSLGGAVVAAHPYDRAIERPAGDLLFTLEGLSAVQARHARHAGSHDDLAVEAADHLNLPCVGGSGALGGPAEVGRAATLFRDPVRSEADVVAQLRAGTAWCVEVGVTPPPPEARSSRSAGPRRDGREGRDGRGGRGGSVQRQRSERTSFSSRK